MDERETLKRKHFHFILKTDEGRRVDGEVEGVNSGRVIIFSHGFGVDRHARGMFDQIKDQLKSEGVVILFDYSEVNHQKKETRTPSLTTQVEMLDEVLKYARKTFKPKEIDVVGHSQGCLVIS